MSKLKPLHKVSKMLLKSHLSQTKKKKKNQKRKEKHLLKLKKRPCQPRCPY